MKKSIVALALMAAVSSNAFAMNNATPLIGIPGVSSSSIEYRMHNGIATLTGSVESGIEATLAKNYVENMEGVDSVINLITSN